MRSIPSELWAVCAGAILIVASTAVSAEEVDISGRISVELNSAQTIEGKCTLSFLVTNGLEQPIEKLVYETVLFTKEGQVERLTLFDFGNLPVGRPRVRQFALQAGCEGFGRILFNGANTCAGGGIAEGACDTSLLLTTKTEIEALG